MRGLISGAGEDLMNRIAGLSFIAILAFITGIAQAQEKPAYLDPRLPPEQRAADLVRRMTLEEKASQLVNQARAIPRLNVPAYDWWSEALHGVMRDGTTEFPEPIGLAATFDTGTIHRMAVVIGTEGRIIHERAVQSSGGSSDLFHGLDFWAPNINIFRDPRWGRGQETYGEDPFLTARMGVAFVTGMQGDDPKYYRVISTPKHFAVHSGPEAARHTEDVTVSKHDEIDTYLYAFRATVAEGKAGSVMCAYNEINGVPACANEFLLQDQLRGHWGFDGYVVSDCGAIVDVYRGHQYEPTQPQASAISLKRGMDNECADGGFKVNDDHDYKAYLDAVKEGYLKESDIDRAVIRLFTARMRLGMFDPPGMAPYSKIDESELNSPENRDLARKIADESMVLLKNDGTLPLKTSGIRIAVIGPLANQIKVLLGNYNGTPTHTVSILEGLRKEFAGATIQYQPGTQFLSRDADPVPASALMVDGKPGIRISFSGLDTTDINHLKATAPVAQRIDPTLDAATEPVPLKAAHLHPLTLSWDGSLIAPETGDYNVGLKADGIFRVSLDGKDVTSAYGADPTEPKLGRVHLVAGKPVALHVVYTPPENGAPNARLLWSKVDLMPQPEAIEAAENADVVIAVLGITSELEGEEMEVSEPGFKGGDRTSLDLPKPEENLLESVVSAGKPVVLVLTGGSALAVNWAKGHVNAILDAWYPGEEGGVAVAETISGKNNPGGRLPVTFYTSVDQLPPFEDYAMKGRTYRYFDGMPLYPFGYGLSYTTFSYSDLALPTNPVAAGQQLTAEATVTNSGPVAGDEVAQFYLRFPNVAGAPIRALRGFQRVHLEPGQSKRLQFHLTPRDISMVTEAGEPIVAEGKYSVSVGGGQPNSGAPTVEGTFEVKGSIVLPE
jgi:beta-glucosidase